MTPRHVLDEVSDKLAPLPQGRELREAVEGLARKHLVSDATIYRWANQAGLRWRKERADKGQGVVGKLDALNIGALLQATRRLSNKVPLPACDAVEILQDSELLTKDVSTSACLRALREHEVSAKDICKPSPHRNLRADHPNHVWQFDVTNCIQYFLDDKKGLGERDQEMELYRNKIVKTAKKIKRELLRYVAVDKCSGAFYFRYFYSTGERAADGIEFLYETMRPKADERYRFHGVPRVIYADKGSIAKAMTVKNMLDALKVELTAHLPGNPRAKGAVEGMMHYINRFEGRLALKRPHSLEELNAWALDWSVKVNALNVFRETGASRSALWQFIRPEQLRLCPDWEVLVTCIKGHKERRFVNGDLLISYDGRQYRLPDSAQARRHVTVCFNPYEFPAIEVTTEDGQVYCLKPIERDVFGQYTDAVTFGEFKAHKHTPTQAAKGEMEEIAEGFGITFKGTADKRRGQAPPLDFESPLKVMGHQADKVGNIGFMDKKGIEIIVGADPSVGPRRVPFIKFMQSLAAAIGRRITKQEYAALQAELGESVAEDMLEIITGRLKGKAAPQEEHIQEKKVVHWRSGQM